MEFQAVTGWPPIDYLLRGTSEKGCSWTHRVYHPLGQCLRQSEITIRMGVRMFPRIEDIRLQRPGCRTSRRCHCRLRMDSARPSLALMSNLGMHLTMLQTTCPQAMLAAPHTSLLYPAHTTRIMDPGRQ
jgi:hypothetical protein